jgi:multiple antibiotic resistance protein
MHFQMNIYSAAVTLFLVMDPVGNIPIFLSLLKQVDPKRRTKIILRESLIALAILTLFLFCGRTILQSLNISQEALGIAGGIILFLIAIKMLFPTQQNQPAVLNGDEPFIVPMAIPLLAGPSAMATVILFASQAPHRMREWFVALVAASLVATLILLFAVPLQKLLGVKVIAALERLMGMILTTIAVQMFLTGLGTYLSRT